MRRSASGNTLARGDDGSMPAAKLGYRPELDGLRAVAILLVIVHHGDLLPGGAFGVDIFFVLSGFLITTLLLAEWERTGTISLAGFYRRRALRLLPALFALLLFFTLLVLALWATGGATNDEVVRALVCVPAGLFYVANFLKAFGGMTALTHLWSLAQEEQFYLLWPVALIFLLRRGTRPSRIMWLLGGLALLSFVDRGGSFLAETSYRRIIASPDARADPILIGCLAAVAVAYFPAVTRALSGRLGTVAGALGAAAVVAAVAWGAHGTSFVFGLVPLEFGTALVIVTMMVTARMPLRSLLATPPLVYTGRISYALYLWHVFFSGPGWTHTLTVGVPASFAAASLSYFLVERRFLRRKATLRRPPPKTVPVPVPV
jgi:peptidoglycan/LPS O-acetylase OafA/YrhL